MLRNFVGELNFIFAGIAYEILPAQHCLLVTCVEKALAASIETAG
jgi:hypothetical protein